MDVHIETEINTPAAKVWQILAHQFAAMDVWTETLSECRALDASEIPAGFKPASGAPQPVRETTSSFAKAIEVIVEYSEQDMRLRFDTANLPAILSSASNTQRVVSMGENRCKIIWDLDIQMRGIFKIMEPLMKRRFLKSFGGIQQELKIYAETGKVASG